MPVDQVASRYAQALFESAKADGQIDQTLEQLAALGALMRDQPDLCELLWNPDVDPDDKVGVLERVFSGKWSGLLRAFSQMVVSLGRTEALPDIVDAFQALVDEDQGRLRVVVRSARPVSSDLLNRLRQGLARREQRTIEMETEIAPQLIGGVQIVLGHRVIDSTVQRQVADLRQQLKSLRVHETGG